MMGRVFRRTEKLHLSSYISLVGNLTFMVYEFAEIHTVEVYGMTVSELGDPDVSRHWCFLYTGVCAVSEL